MQTEPINPLNPVEAQAQEFKRIPVDQVLFLEEPRFSETEPRYVIPSKKSSKAGLRKHKAESQNQQNIVDLLGQEAKTQKAANSEQLSSSSYDANFYERLEECLNNQKFEETLKETCKLPPIAYAVQSGYLDVVKFMIDNNENLNICCYCPKTTTPIIYYWPGFTPLEIAIKKQDIEMVKTLLFYNPNNFADVNFSHSRNFCVVSGLSDTLLCKNIQIIDLILQTFKDPKSLYDIYDKIKSTKSSDIMKSFLTRYKYLLKNETEEVSDQEVDLFLNSSLLEKIKNQNYNVIKQFLDFGWLVSAEDFRAALNTNNIEIVDLLMASDKFIIEEQKYREEKVTYYVRISDDSDSRFDTERGRIEKRTEIKKIPLNNPLDPYFEMLKNPCYDSLAIKYMEKYIHKDLLMKFIGLERLNLVDVALNNGIKLEQNHLIEAMRVANLDILLLLIEKGAKDISAEGLLTYAFRASKERFMYHALDIVNILLDNFEFSQNELDKVHSLMSEHIMNLTENDDKDIISKAFNTLKKIDEKRNLR